MLVYLRALDKLQGVFEVMGLLKGKIISCCKVIPIPITQEFIDRYESLSDKDIIKSLLKFKYSKREQFTRMMMKMMTTMVQSQEWTTKMKSNTNQPYKMI